MKLQIASIALVLSIACLSADAYAPASLISRPSTAFVSSSRIPKTTATTSSQLFSQWDEEEEEDVAISTTPSFEDADKALGDEEDQAALDERGDDYDASANYNANDIDRYREAIKKRTEALGMEKKTPEEIADEEAMAAAARDDSPDDLSQMLDLSQITTDAPRGPDENLPAMMYDPSKDMTEEEMAEADPIGLKPWNEQVAWVFSKSEYPGFFSAFTETVILVVTVTVTALVITQWDDFMRDVAVNYQGIPKPKDVASGSDGIIEQGEDMLKFLQEGTKATVDAIKDGSIVDILAGDVPQDL